jgi:hypothetical protein
MAWKTTANRITVEIAYEGHLIRRVPPCMPRQKVERRGGDQLPLPHRKILNSKRLNICNADHITSLGNLYFS